ncbi:TlpA disulfide reductase family protein [Curvivirga sp.]|uniref:TlpA disulfide reductase family protein n=1 Tax=Curvivirga sp. TaxID=2856848 RepID=UPI003B59838C
MKLFKIKLLFAVLATFLLLDQPIMQSAQASDAFPPTKGDMRGFILLKQRELAPEVPFFDGEGNVRHIKDFKGQVILVNFWATWCAPCIKEMPDLDQLEADLGSDDFKVVAISQDLMGAKKAGPFLRDRLKLENLDLFIDKRTKLGRAFGVKGLPATFLIDREGLVVGYYTGPAHWASDDAKAMINYVINE